MPNRVMDCRVKPGNDGGEAREPGPITTALTIRIRHGVWVPACAGATEICHSGAPRSGEPGMTSRNDGEAFALSLSQRERVPERSEGG